VVPRLAVNLEIRYNPNSDVVAPVLKEPGLFLFMRSPSLLLGGVRTLF
jgi:hypothetical protein